MTTRVRLSAVIGLLVLLTASHAYAQAAGVGTVDQIIQQFKNQSDGWGATLQNLAMTSFGILALIEIGWALIKSVIRAGGLSDFADTLISELVFIGIFFLLLKNAVSWSTLIVNSFRHAAQLAGAPAVTPGAVMASGVNIAQQVMSVSALTHPISFIGFMIAAIVIIVCFASITFMMAAALVESYLIIQAGVLLMAFGGSRWTENVARATIQYAVAVGAKLMILQFLASIGTNFVQQWAAGFKADNNTPMLIVIGCSIVLLGICKIVPDTFQRLVGGASLASGSAIAASAGMVGAGVAGVALAGAGAGSAALSAFRLAGSQMAERERSSTVDDSGNPIQQSRIARAATMTGYAARNLASAAGTDIGRRLSGQAGGGRASWRIASNLSKQNAQLRGRS